MRQIGKVGIDVNKRSKCEVPEMGGLAGVFGFIVASVLVLGITEIADIRPEIFSTLYVAVGVLLAATIIGFLDDLGIIKRREKAFLIMFASLPLVIARPIRAQITITEGLMIDFTSPYIIFLIFWLIIVPIAVLGCANALNMSAGYNGLESGIPLIISFFMMLVLGFKDSTNPAIFIFAGTCGVSLATFAFNKYPSQIFIGDVGTLGFGAAFAVGVIIGDIAIYGFISIIPAFFELYEILINRNIPIAERRKKVMNPIIHEDGSLSCRKGAETYSLANYLLSKGPMNEKDLVHKILSFYIVSGIIAIALYFFMDVVI